MPNLCGFQWLLLFLYFRGVVAPSCYVCNSQTEPLCGNTFMLQRSDRQYIHRCSTSCYMFVAQKDENAVISRGCLPGIKTIPRCRFDERDGLYGVMCTCNESYCNFFTRLRYNVLTMLSSFAIAWICVQYFLVST